MKKVILSIAAVLTFGLMATSCGGGVTGGKVSLKTAADSAAYANGILTGEGMGMQLKNLPGPELDVDILLNGIAKGLKGEKTQMTMEEAQMFLQDYFPRVVEEAKAMNKEEGEKFLAENAKKEGVVTTESGLQYKVTEMGDGIKATSVQDTVVIHYTGTLLDGTKFDSSHDRNEPATFALEHVIKGWQEGVLLFPAGSKFTLWIPSELAYGEYGAGGSIEPNSTIVFDCELLEVRPYVPAE
ncbi:MAG: FKBP-type peptidyl-prolyl cis-trans isomerase [Porphyromonas sp.]|nr:FKBP-type peptidyl-prolyl cis-trans isomerase [Porphyromonas sp.]